MIGAIRTTALPGAVCPTCGGDLSGCTGRLEDEGNGVSCCVHCGEILKVAADFTPSLMPDDEVAELPCMMLQRIAKTQKIIREINAAPAYLRPTLWRRVLAVEGKRA